MTATGASPYVAYRLDADVAAKLGLPDMVFPVRRARVEEIFGGDEVRFDLVVDELDRYVATRPDAVDDVAPVIARLTHLVGTIEGSEGRPDVAARYFARGLSYAPDSFRLNTDLAFAYQVQGRLPEAAAHYRRALAIDPDNPLVLLLAARANHALGYDDVALEMLEACPTDYRRDPGFLDLYVSVGGEPPTRSAAEEEPAPAG